MLQVSKRARYSVEKAHRPVSVKSATFFYSTPVRALLLSK